MGQVLKLIASSRQYSPGYTNISHLPSSQQAKLYELMARFDRVMKERPEVAARILYLSEKLLHMFDA